MFDIYQSNQHDSARYVLGCSGKKMLMCLGLNPSTANQIKPDTTIAKVAKVARGAHYDGYAMVNLYPLRSTITNTLPPSVEPELFQANLRYLLETLDNYRLQDIWASWGQGILLRSYFVDALQAIVEYCHKQKINWLQYGPSTQHGHPRHPSRLQYSWRFARFDIQSYLEHIRSNY